METTIIRAKIMERVRRIYLLKKSCGKFCMFVFASAIGMTFVSTIDVIRNIIYVASQQDVQAFLNYIQSAFINTEHITYVAFVFAVMAIIWMASDILSFKMHKIEFD